MGDLGRRAGEVPREAGAEVSAAEAAAVEFAHGLSRSFRGMRQALGQLVLALKGGISHPRSKGWRRHVRRVKAAK